MLGVRVPPGVPKRKTSAFSRCLSFWVLPPEGRLHPSAFQCSGSAEPPLRNSRPQAGNLRATRRAAQKGRWAVFLLTVSKMKISILTVPSSSSQAICRLRRAFSFHCKTHRALILLLLASKPDPLSLVSGLGPPLRGGFVLSHEDIDFNRSFHNDVKRSRLL